MRRSRQRRRRGKITRHPFGPMRLAFSLCLRASLALSSQRNRLEGSADAAAGLAGLRGFFPA